MGVLFGYPGTLTGDAFLILSIIFEYFRAAFLGPRLRLPFFWRALPQ